MADPPLDVSPLAVLLLDLAGRGSTGRLLFGERTLLLRDGDVADVLPASGDASLEQCALEQGLVPRELFERVGPRAREQGTGVLQLLQAEGHVEREALARMRRDVLCQRLARAFRQVEERGEPLPVLEPAPEASRGASVGLVAMVLDALAEDDDGALAQAVGAQLNHRLELNGGDNSGAALDWAELELGSQRPALSSILARQPGAGPRLAALLRAGVARLSEPGKTGTSAPPRSGTLPPPPPRLSVVPSTPAKATSVPASDPIANLSSRPPRMRLDPGGSDAETDPLLPTKLTRLPAATVELDDPLAPIEQRIAELEASQASGPERARAFCGLADTWRERFGSTERACRAFREAAAADPGDVRVLEQAALHCHYLGDNALAARYAKAAVEMAPIPIDRASAQRLRAIVLRAQGDIDGYVEALCEAAADDPTTPEPHELVAAVLLERGNVDGANAHARLGAAAQIDESAGRAGALLDYAWSIKQADVPTAYEYASLLDTDHRRPAAVAVLAATAAATTDPDARRKLRLAAAQRAEAASRPDMAAELLAAAFDAEPYFDLLYTPLEEDLKDVEPPEYRAALLEDVATACPESQRAHWLTRAGNTTLEIGGQEEAAIWLFYEALLTDPTHRAALEALTEHGTTRRSLMVRAQGLRTCISHALGAGDDVTALLVELARLADGELDNPELARAAWTQLERLGHREDGLDATLARLAEVCDARRDALQAAEARLASAGQDARVDAMQEVLRLLPDLPEHWQRRLALLTELDGLRALDAHQREELETLHGLSRNAVALAAYLEDAAERASAPAQRVSLLRRLAAVHTVREDTPAVANVAQALLEIDASDAVGQACLERAARKLDDRERLYRALELRLVGSEGRARARLHARLARVAERLEREAEAAEHARLALEIDPDAADAAFVYLRTAHRLDPARALSGMAAVRGVLGPSRRLFILWTHAARAAADGAALTQAAEAWAEVLPMDAEARAAEIQARARDAEPNQALRTCDAALSAIPCDEVIDATRTVIDALARRGEPVAATRLALRVAEEQGHPDQAFARQTVSLARRTGDPMLITRALELQISRSEGEERAQVLLDLAAHHRDYRDHAGEARALQRILELDTHHGPALRQLEALFRAAGEAGRLAAVSTLALEAEKDPEARRARLLDLIALFALELDDPEGSDFHIRRLIAESTDDSRWLRLALGALLEVEPDERAGLLRCIAIADECPPELGHRIYLWVAVSAEQRLGDAELACELALQGTHRFPTHAELLLIVERLTLERDDVDAAMQAYDLLLDAAVGPHGSRALVYRAGRWLERSGRLDQALDRYLQAFELAPAGGAALKAVERVAHATGRLEALLSCYEQLVELATDPGARVDLLLAAAQLCARMQRHERALSLTMDANAMTEGHALDDQVALAARAVVDAQPAAAAGVWTRVCDELSERAEQLWDGTQKARCLLRLARTLALELRDFAPALRHLEAAAAALEGEEADDPLLATVDMTRAEIENEAGQVVEARKWLQAARRRAPDLPGLAALAGRIGDEPESDPDATPDEAPMRASVAQIPMVDVAGVPASDSQAAPARPSIPLARMLSGRPEAAAEARTLLRRTCTAQPWNTEALRALHDASVEGPASEHWVTGTLLSLFDRGVECPPDLGVRPSFWREVDVQAVVGKPWSDELGALLTRLWEGARSVTRFRNTPQELGIRERDRITRLTVGPVAEAYALATRILGTHRIDVYVALQTDALAAVLPTHPPCVVAARQVGGSPAALRYAMARALWLAQPHFAIPAALQRQDAEDLLDGARAAFAPRTGPQRLSNAATEVAAGLWQALPAGEQRAMERVLSESAEALSYDTLHAAAMENVARAALIGSGALLEALRHVANEDASMSGLDISREQDFARACRRSTAFCATVQCALSEEFLAAVEAVL